MNEDFHTWVSRNANSIVDKSIVAKAPPESGITELQIRVRFADLIVKKFSNMSDTTAWMNVVCTSNYWSSEFPSKFIGYEKAEEWYSCKTLGECLQFIAELKELVNKGWKP